MCEALKGWGWNPWFESRAHCGERDNPARVVAVDRDQWLLVDGEGAFRARLAGAYAFHHADPHAAGRCATEDLPCVGDWVCVERGAGEGVGLIHAVVERRSVLRRKVAGEAVAAQLIAANVDTVVIVQACHFDFNVKRLERYLVMARDSGAEPWVLLTKTDLVAPEVLAAQLGQLRAEGVLVPVLTLSNVTGEGQEALRAMLSPGRTYCFVGSSGVGKSTLINGLVGRDVMETGGTSGTGEGRHTTVRRELIRLEGGALVIDNPGMRELGMLGAEAGLDARFADIGERASACRFRDCTHTGEPGCAVRDAVEAGEIGQAHFDSYHKLRDESDFNTMSYAERRKRDKDFGKFMKSVKKDLRRR